ncbi:PEP-CTERM sorting domain-containing protein [Rhodoferax sp. GW822-FHT02A01]|uniref:PEP-CTERM sorting domain-containing protein n=1 Tax=Rhodoferax sp. GW822-FHT02A01 TaxID=3141537 RepID=UPI00315D87A7
MMNKTFAGSALLALLLSVNVAHAELAVNTGTPDNTGSQIAVDSADWLAGQVTFNQAYQVNSISAYLDQLFPGGNDFSITLYSNTSANKVGSQLYSSTATFTGTGWNGASNLNWTVDSGTYWIGLEVSDTQGSNLVAPQIATGTPLTRTAITSGNGYDSHQSGASAYQFGLRVDVAPVPEPTSVAMLLAGIGLIGVALKKRNSLQA